MQAPGSLHEAEAAEKDAKDELAKLIPPEAQQKAGGIATNIQVMQQAVQGFKEAAAAAQAEALAAARDRSRTEIMYTSRARAVG